MENEGQPMIAPNHNLRYLRQFFLIIAITLLLGGAIQFLSVLVYNIFFDVPPSELASFLQGTLPPDNRYTGPIYILMIFSSLSFLIPALILPSFLKEDPAELIQINNWAPMRMYIISLVLLVIIIPVVNHLLLLNKELFDLPFFSSYKAEVELREKNVRNTLSVVLDRKNIIFLLLNILTIAILPAISEEFLFRGVIQKHIYNWTANIHIAIWTAAILFSAIHLQWMGFLPRMLLGVILGYILYYSGTIWVAVLAHALNNALVVLSTYWLSQNSELEILREDYQPPLMVVAISAVLSVLVFYLLKRFRTRPEEIPA